jgi:hypothetical protein
MESERDRQTDAEAASKIDLFASATKTAPPAQEERGNGRLRRRESSSSS